MLVKSVVFDGDERLLKRKRHLREGNEVFSVQFGLDVGAKGYGGFRFFQVRGKRIFSSRTIPAEIESAQETQK